VVRVFSLLREALAVLLGRDIEGEFVAAREIADPKAALLCIASGPPGHAFAFLLFRLVVVRYAVRVRLLVVHVCVLSFEVHIWEFHAVGARLGGAGFELLAFKRAPKLGLFLIHLCMLRVRAANAKVPRLGEDVEHCLRTGATDYPQRHKGSARPVQGRRCVGQHWLEAPAGRQCWVPAASESSCSSHTQTQWAQCRLISGQKALSAGKRQLRTLLPWGGSPKVLRNGVAQLMLPRPRARQPGSTWARASRRWRARTGSSARQSGRRGARCKPRASSQHLLAAAARLAAFRRWLCAGSAAALLASAHTHCAHRLRVLQDPTRQPRCLLRHLLRHRKQPIPILPLRPRQCHAVHCS